MFKRILLGLILLGLISCSSSYCHASPKQYTIAAERSVKRTGFIMFKPDGFGDEIQPILVGSAWAVRNGWDYRVVTAQHVGLAIAFMPGTTYLCSYIDHCIEVDIRASMLAIDDGTPLSDWMYMDVDSLPEGMRSSSMGPSPWIGERVCAVGAPLGRAGEYTCGQVTNSTLGAFYMDARILPGNSGGPVFNSRGQVVGMVIAIDYPESEGLPAVPTSAYAIEMRVIKFE